MTQQRGSIVYLGSGLCSDLDTLLQSNPERIYLIEPNPAFKDVLAQLCETHPSVEHLACGVTATGGRQVLNIYNFFDLSSFSAPQDLFKIYPGALLETAPEVQTLTPTDLLAALHLPDGAPHILLVETTGIEYALLEAFITSGTLLHFTHLTVKMPAHDLFKGSRNITQIDTLIESAGYRKRQSCAKTENADWQLREYTFDHQAHRIAQLEKDNAALEQDRMTLAQKNTALQAERDTAHKQRAQAQADAQAAAALTKDAAAKAETLTQKNTALQEERDTAHKQRAQAQEDAQAAATLTKDVTAKAETLTQENTALQAELDTAHKQRTQGQADAQAAALEKKALSLRAELTMVLRIQTRLQSNQQELQGRFETLQKEKRAQDALVVALIQKLDTALDAPVPPQKKATTARKKPAASKT